jgi:Domain of unknown function DUF1828/Domain of unknown function DUF1829
MEFSANNIIDEYLKWIKDNTHVFALKDSTHEKVVTPFLDNSNDHIQIYILKSGDDSFVLTDDGATIAHLSMNGVDLNTPRRKKILEEVVRSYSAEFNSESGEILIRARKSNIGQKKHNFIQALLAISDMSQLSTDNITSIFKEEVAEFLTLSEIGFITDVNIVGKSSFQHHIDFAIPSPYGEFLVKTLNVPKKDQIMSSLFIFSDIKEQREKSHNVIFYNDTIDGAKLSQESQKALDEYGIETFKWSQKQELTARLKR